jgi:two-component system, LuxR family, response regulator FixJ
MLRSVVTTPQIRPDVETGRDANWLRVARPGSGLWPPSGAYHLETLKAIMHDPDMRKPIIYIVDDQLAVCSALREMLSVRGNEVEAFGSARNFLDAFDATRPACLVADVRMPDMDGIELVRELERNRVGIPAVLMSGYADVQMAVKAIKAGAEDFIEKPGGDELTLAIERCLALSTERFASRQSQDDLERRFRSLTPREVEVFDLVAQGRTSQEIAATIGKSPSTVDIYRIQIMAKMQADSIIVLVRQAVRLKRMNA